MYIDQCVISLRFPAQRKIFKHPPELLLNPKTNGIVFTVKRGCMRWRWELACNYPLAGVIANMRFSGSCLNSGIQGDRNREGGGREEAGTGTGEGGGERERERERE
jgi:hypothetical protein